MGNALSTEAHATTMYISSTTISEIVPKRLKMNWRNVGSQFRTIWSTAATLQAILKLSVRPRKLQVFRRN